MVKQAIVVVHGVGVREAGVCTDLLSAALEGDRGADALHPHSTDDFRLPEYPKYSVGGKYQTYPARLRRYKTAERPDPARKRVIVDFYWGDVTGTGRSAVNLVVGIFRLMLGLSHAVRENGWAVFGDRRDWIARLGSFAALVIHGPLFALNLVLAVAALLLGLGSLAGLWTLGAAGSLPEFWVPAAGAGVLAALGLALLRRGEDRYLRGLAALILGLAMILLVRALGQAGDGQILLALSGLTIALALVLRLRAHAFLLRHLSDWLIIIALLVAVLALSPGLRAGLVGPNGLVPKPMPEATCVLTEQGDGAAAEKASTADGAKAEDKSCPFVSATIVETGMIMAGLGMLLWLVVLQLCFLLMVRRAVLRFSQRPRVGGQGHGQDFQAEALGLMLVIWLLVTGVFWGAGLKLAGQMNIAWGVPSSWVRQQLLFVPVAILGFGLILLAMGVQFLWVAHWSSRPGARRGYVGARAMRAEAGRLVVSRLAIWVLWTVILGGAAWGWLVFAPSAGLDSKAIVEQVKKVLEPWIDHSLVVLAFTGAAIVGTLNTYAGMGVGIVIDVLSYINSYSWASWQEAGVNDHRAAQRHSRTVLERLFGWRQPAPAPLPGAERTRRKIPQGYWLRRRIQDRLRTLVDTLIKDEAPDEILFISHSQGTMIALDVIERFGRRWKSDVPRPGLSGPRLRLVTMGSPYMHVYHHYFSRGFPVPAARPHLAPAAQGGVLRDWVNIFRIDDFIGTHIDPDPGRDRGKDCWPREIAVKRNGHTNYWIDEQVARLLRTIVRF